MPIIHEVRDGALLLRMSGKYSTADLRHCVLEAIDTLGDANAIGMCFDVSESESLVTRTAEEVTAMGYFLASYGDRFGRRIALIGANDFSFGMMRLGSVALDRENISSAVFRNERDACGWIKSPQPTQFNTA